MPPQYQQAFLDVLDFKPPAGYLAYLFAVESTYEFNGAYFIEDHELLQYNADREAAEVYLGYFLIGSDGVGEALAIEKATGNFVAVPFIGHDEGTAIIIGRTWDEFLQRLQAENLFDDE